MSIIWMEYGGSGYGCERYSVLPYASVLFTDVRTMDRLESGAGGVSTVATGSRPESQIQLFPVDTSAFRASKALAARTRWGALGKQVDVARSRGYTGSLGSIIRWQSYYM